jgi:hypothetical protein
VASKFSSFERRVQTVALAPHADAAHAVALLRARLAWPSRQPHKGDEGAMWAGDDQRGLTALAKQNTYAVTGFNAIRSRFLSRFSRPGLHRQISCWKPRLLSR